MKRQPTNYQNPSAIFAKQQEEFSEKINQLSLNLQKINEDISKKEKENDLLEGIVQEKRNILNESTVNLDNLLKTVINLNDKSIKLTENLKEKQREQESYKKQELENIEKDIKSVKNIIKVNEKLKKVQESEINDKYSKINDLNEEIEKIYKKKYILLNKHR